MLANGNYWVFYSGNWFNEPYYAIGVAECRGPAGPCSKPSRPFLASNAQGQGPGESSLFTGRNGLWIVYSPWAIHYRTDTPRPVALAHIAFNASGPYLTAPSSLESSCLVPRRHCGISPHVGALATVRCCANDAGAVVATHPVVVTHHLSLDPPFRVGEWGAYPRRYAL
jgi:hypothetical protein